MGDVPLSTPYSPPSILDPISVFISSDSEEFADLRNQLQRYIDAEYMYNEERTHDEDERAILVHQGKVMKAILVERGSAESFEEAMKNDLDKSQIYVGIFGNRDSEPTRKEYDYARQLGLPLLVYYFTVPPRIARGLHTNVVRFLGAQTRQVRIRGNYRKIVARTPTDLIDIILSDLACKVPDIVREAIAMRQMLVEKAPVSVIGAIQKVRKTVFD